MMMMMSSIISHPSSSSKLSLSTQTYSIINISPASLNQSTHCCFYNQFKYSYKLMSKPINHLILRVPTVTVSVTSKGSPRHSIYKPFSSPVMEMQDCTVKMEVDVPTSVAYNCYLDRESMPKWMPFISSVQVMEDKPDQSRWTLKYEAFGRDIEFSWLARNLQPIPNQKIHWRSLEGLPNSGAVRFYPKGPSSCLVELTVSYEVPQILAPVASALQPFLQSLLLRGLERFSDFAKSRQPDLTS